MNRLAKVTTGMLACMLSCRLIHRYAIVAELDTEEKYPVMGAGKNKQVILRLCCGSACKYASL
jgi:hypothetical protein